ERRPPRCSAITPDTPGRRCSTPRRSRTRPRRQAPECRGSSGAYIVHGLCEDRGDTMRDAVFAVHFFNWYWTSAQQPLPELEKEWTFHPAWEEMGILPEEIGHTKNYYQRQFERIRQAGFDAV